MRLRAHRNGRVKVPDLADTVGPATESNCIGATSPGGEQLEVNHQSVTRTARMGGQSELDSVGGSGEPAMERRSPNKIVRPALREWNAPGRGPQMIGDRMVGSSGDVNQGTTAGDDKRACRGQSVRSSEEASNDRGAKGRRKAVLGAEPRPSREDQRSAARLFALVRRKTAWLGFVCRQWAARNWVNGSVRTAWLACSLRASGDSALSQPIGDCRPESRMREIRLSGLGGRGSAWRSSYPHFIAHNLNRNGPKPRRGGTLLDDASRAAPPGLEKAIVGCSGYKYGAPLELEPQVAIVRVSRLMPFTLPAFV